MDFSEIEKEVDLLADQQVDKIIDLLIVRRDKITIDNINDKLNHYISLKLQIHRMKKRISWGDFGDSYEVTIKHLEFLTQKAKEVRKDYYDTKHRS